MRLVIYGAGNKGRYVAENLKDIHKIICLVDKDASKRGILESSNIPIITIQELNCEFDKIIVCVVGAYIDIKNNLIELGFAAEKIVDWTEVDNLIVLNKKLNSLNRNLAVLEDYIYQTMSLLQLEDKGNAVLFLNDTYNTYHHGSSAVSMLIHSQLQKNHRAVLSIGLEEIAMMQLTDDCTLENLQSYEQFINWKKNNVNIFTKIMLCKEIVVNGEGTISQYLRTSVNLLYIIYVASTFMNKNVYMINSSILPDNFKENAFNKKLMENIIHLTLKNIKCCYVREKYSLQFMRSLFPEKTELSFDSLPLYIRDIYLQRKIDTLEPYILIASGSYLPDWYIDFVVYICDVLIKESQVKEIAVITSDVQMSDYPQNIDTSIYDELLKHFGQQTVKYIHAGTTDEWLSYHEKTSYLLSGRFHHSIAAFMFETPFICLPAENRKLDGALELMSAADHMIVSDTFEEAINEFHNKLRSGAFKVENAAGAKENILRLAEKQYLFHK